jgi:hypothetical protein
MTIRLLMAIAVVSIASAEPRAGVAAALPATRPATRPVAGPPVKDWGLPLLMTVRLTTPEVKPGNDLQFFIEFANESDRPIVVMAPVDGAQDGMRQVSYSWSLTTRDGRPIPRRLYGRCGNFNSAETHDFVTVPPHGKARVESNFLMSPVDLMDEKGPGEFRATLTYSFDRSRREADGKLGRDAPGTASMLKQAWVGTVLSDPVTFRIVP